MDKACHQCRGEALAGGYWNQDQKTGDLYKTK